MRYLGIMIGLLFLIGCASVPMAPRAMDQQAKQFEAPEGKALIYVTRQNFFGHAYLFRLLLDGELIGQVAYKTYHVMEVAPGEHTLIAMTEGNQDRQQFEVDAGELIFFDLVPGGFSTVTATIERLTDEEGKKIVADSRMAAPLKERSER